MAAPRKRKRSLSETDDVESLHDTPKMTTSYACRTCTKKTELTSFFGGYCKTCIRNDPALKERIRMKVGANLIKKRGGIDMKSHLRFRKTLSAPDFNGGKHKYEEWVRHLKALVSTFLRLVLNFDVFPEMDFLCRRPRMLITTTP